MAIEEILDEIENLVEASSRFPFVGKVIIDGEQLNRLIDDARRALPQELQEAARVLKDREKILDDARKEGEKFKEQARIYSVTLVEEHTIVKQAEKRAEEINEEARRVAHEMEMSMTNYADTVLERVETNLQKALQVVQQTHSEFRQKYSEK